MLDFLEDFPEATRAPALSRSIDAAHRRASQLVAKQAAAIGRRTDRLFAWLFIFQWLGGIAAAIWIAHPHVTRSVLVDVTPLCWITFAGTLASLVPLVAIWRYPGAPATRHIVAVAQMVWAALLFQYTGGRIGTHFPVFGSLAILACYRDWRVLVTAVLMVVTHDLARGNLWSSDGAAALQAWERLAFVIMEVAALMLVIRLTARENWMSAISQAKLEDANRRLDAEFRQRSKNFRQYTERLERIHFELHSQAEELQKARAAAEQANAAKSNLVATVSHEIRTPMTAILGYADVLLGTLQNAEQLKAARTIRHNGEFLLKLVDDILDLSKIESGKLTVEQVPCSPAQIVNDVVQVLKVRADAKNLPLQVEIADKLPAIIHTDPMRLRQILLNLVSNAIKFSSRGDVRITVSTDDSGAEPRLRIVVRDQGIGLTPRQIAKLFYPYAQGDNTTSRLYGGSGLGLWISRRLANLLGGEIVVESTPSQGSTFTVTVAMHSEAGLAQARTTQAPGEETVKPIVVLRDRRVLVADDNPDNRELVEFVLNKAGAQVTAVEDGRQAVDTALEAEQADQAYDVVLMDVQMPVLDGFGAAAELREAGYSGLIIALTADARPEQVQSSQMSGCDACLSKPIDGSLLGVISQLRGRDASAPVPPVA